MPSNRWRVVELDAALVDRHDVPEAAELHEWVRAAPAVAPEAGR